MTVQEPDARVIGAKAEDGVSATGDLYCVAEGGVGEIIWLGTSSAIIIFNWLVVRGLKSWRDSVDEGIV